MIQNKLLVLFGFTSIFFNEYLSGRLATGYYDAYFQMVPIRWIFPCALMAFSVYYLKYRSRMLYYFSFPFFSLGILWNPEFGIATYLSLLAFYFYLELCNAKILLTLKKIFVHSVIGLSSIILISVLYVIIIKVFYGAFPDLLKMFSTIKTFAQLGFGLLPMPSAIHPWMLIALVCSGPQKLDRYLR